LKRLRVTRVFGFGLTRVGNLITTYAVSFQPAPGSNVNAQAVNVDDGAKVPLVQLLDISSSDTTDGKNDLTSTSELSASRPTPAADVDRSTVLSPRPPDQTAVNQSSVEAGTSGLSSQENTVTRTRSRDVMDFAHLKMKLVELTGTNKDAATASSAAATTKTKTETEEAAKDASLDAVVLNSATHSTSQVAVGRTVAADTQPVAHRGLSLSPELGGTTPGQAASQQTSMPELPVSSAGPRDASIAPLAATVQAKPVPSNGEQSATAPVQPVKPVAVYPISVAQGLPVNGATAIPGAGVFAPDLQSAMLLQQQYQLAAAASAVPGVLDGVSGFAPVQSGLMADIVATGSPASPDGMGHVMAPAQQPAADYSPVSLLALYNQMMMPLPFMAPARTPALGLNPFLVAANPLLAAQMMYGAGPMMPPVSEPFDSSHIGVQSYQEHLQQPVLPPGVSLDHAQAIRPPTGLVAPLHASMPGMPLTSMMLPTAGAAARPLIAPRLPAAHDPHYPAVHAATIPARKRPDCPPHLANLEQALIEKLHGGPRKPAPPMIPLAAQLPAAPSVPLEPPGTMAWFPMPYAGQQIQPTAQTLPAAGQSPVVSPLFATDLQTTGASFNLAPPLDMATATSATLPIVSSLAPASTYSGRTTPFVSGVAEPIPSAGTAVTAVTNKSSGESVEAAAAAATAEKPQTASSVSLSADNLPLKRKLQFTVSAVKDDPLAGTSQKESTPPVSEAAAINSEPVSQNLPQNAVSMQNHVSVPSSLPEPTAVVASTSRAPVKKGRFRISDVKEGTDTVASNGPSEGSGGGLPAQEGSLSSGAKTDSSNQCETTEVPALPEPQQVGYQVFCLSSYQLMY